MTEETSLYPTIMLRLLCPLPPSFKNCKRSGKNIHTGKLMSFTEPEVKQRMEHLENAILSELYSFGKTYGEGMEAECMRRLRTALSGLSDDSLNEIPQGSFSCMDVDADREGIMIVIEEVY